MKTKYFTSVVLFLAVGFSLSAKDLINNLSEPWGDSLILSPGFGVGTSFRTASEYYSVESVTSVHALHMPGSPAMRLKLIEVQNPLVVVGELREETQTPGLGGMHITSVPTDEVLLKPKTEYLLLTDIDTEGLLSVDVAATTSTGSETGYEFIHDWMAFDDVMLWWPVVNPLSFRMVGELVENVNYPPDVSAAAASVAVLWPANGALVPVTIVGVTDPDGDPVTITISSVQQNEPVNWPSARLAPDAFVEEEVVALRAERLGSGAGRVYTVTFQADDGKPGGISSGVVKVAVPLQKKALDLDEHPTSGYFDSTAAN